MNALVSNSTAVGSNAPQNRGVFGTALQTAIASAAGTIAPSWPLDQAVAINPHWRRVDQPIRHVAARLAVLADFHVFPSREYMRKAWDEQRINHTDLDAALAAQQADDAGYITAAQCIAGLTSTPQVQQEPLLVDLLDDKVQKNKRWPWREAIVFQMSQVCATYFDRHQAHWRAAGSESLYGFWRESIAGDHGIGSQLGLARLGTRVRQLPARAEDAAAWAMQRLALPQAVWPNYLEALLLSINGWASWCAYVHWQNIPADKDDPRIRELLICRLVWEALLADCIDIDRSNAALAKLATNWQAFDERVADAEQALRIDETWQQALDISYQRDLAATLRQPKSRMQATDIEAQAVFCIDTRSERMRRALESIWSGVETRAFAGFFGIPMAYNPLGTDIQRPQLPGLAYPSVDVSDQIVPPSGQAEHTQKTANDSTADPSAPARHARWRHLARFDQWLGTVHWPSATFSFVEAAGVGYLPKIAHWLRPWARARISDDAAGIASRHQAHCRPIITGLNLAAKVDLAAQILHTMGLDDRLAPLVVLCGHSGQCENNAHASTLDCGACYGRPGEANARALALLLNEPTVRSGLADEGLHIPDETVFMGALHNTTTDEVTGFDLDLLPPDALRRWRNMDQVFAAAGNQIRSERAPTLWMNGTRNPKALLKQFRRRANDGAQTRPEWGLTRNAAFIIGPRSRSHGRKLPRCYLHDYNAQYDPDGRVLAALMMGPMLVTHWLNWQYHASTCDPLHYGSGNKVLHNVVGGHLGVFEGNGGDLRIGLPKQSLHNGDGWFHEPVRLTVIIDAPAASIQAVIDDNTILQQLLDNDWMLLWRYAGDALQRYAQGHWLPLDT